MLCIDTNLPSQLFSSLLIELSQLDLLHILALLHILHGIEDVSVVRNDQFQCIPECDDHGIPEQHDDERDNLSNISVGTYLDTIGTGDHACRDFEQWIDAYTQERK